MGLSILAGGLAFVGSANAVDLVVNGSFETSGGWTGTFGTYTYNPGDKYYRGPVVPASELPGSRWSWRHAGPGGISEPLTQTVNLLGGATPAEIDSNQANFVFSAWMAGYGQTAGGAQRADPERTLITLQFFDASGTTQLGPTIAHDRGYGLNFTTFADGVTTFDNTDHEYHWAKYAVTSSVPVGARSAKIGVTRSPDFGLGGQPDTYTDLVKLDVSGPFTPASVASALPQGPDLRQDSAITIVIQDRDSQVNTNSIQLTLDGASVSPSITKTGAVTTVAYDPPGLLPPASAHTYRIVFNDNHTPVTRQTNQFNFSVLSYYNLLLPAPIHFENFESTAEGSLPAGWTSLSYSDLPDPNCDFLSTGAGGLQDLNSACYGYWVVVDSSRFQTEMLSYNSHDPTTDYQRVLSVNPANVVNNAIVENLAQGKIAFGDSGYRDGNAQVVYLFSRDFDLTGHNNVYLSYHSMWEQNQDSIGAVEYSIDEGATWLPVVYMLDGPDIVRTGDGSIDALATFTNLHTADGFQAVATYIDPNDSQLKGGYYGAFIGVASNLWSTLGSYISARNDDNPVESKRVEIFRLPAADNQSKVRLRFAHAGTDSWYFGIDNVGLYSITTVSPPTLAGPRSVTEYHGNTTSLGVAPLGIGPFTYQWRRNGSNLSGQTNSSLVLSNVQSPDALPYDVVVGYPGGSITSTQAVLTLFRAPARVVGQWDFDSFDLTASCGQDLGFSDLSVQLNTFFDSSDVFGLPRLNGQSVRVMNFPGKPPEGPMNGYKMFHGIPGNGGGTNVNQYTLIFDILYPATSQGLRRALLQTDPDNVETPATSADFRVDESNGIGVDGVYQGKVETNQWHRIALAVDLSGPGPNPIVAKFIDGVKVGQQTLGAGRDARWSLSAAAENPWALLFAGADTEVQPGYVSSIQLRNGRLSDAELVRLGGPSASKIPGCITITKDGGNLVVSWTGGVALQTATSLSGPWSDIGGATTPYTVPGPLGTMRFFRPKP